jgi:hypothetical protein
MFHNSNHNCDNIVKKSDAQSLSSMKLQEKQRGAPASSSIQHHHPGYIPTKLWQIFNENERCAKSNFVSQQSASESTSGESINYDRNENRKATNYGTLQFMPTCFDCGGVIQPGVMNTTIRMVETRHKVDATTATTTTSEISESPDVHARLSRTQRRRESRFKAKLCRKEYYGSKEQHQEITNYNHSSNKSLRPHAKSKIWQYIWQQQNKNYHKKPTTSGKKKSVYPFLNCCKHYFVLTCGSCGVQILLPDLNSNNATSWNVRSNKNERMKHSVMQDRKSPSEMTSKTSQLLTPSSLNSVNKLTKMVENKEVLIEDDQTAAGSELLNLPRSSAHSSTTPIISINPATSRVKRKEPPVDAQPQPKLQALDPALAIPSGSLTLHQQGKKKKSKNVKGKNDLMAFLSSLTVGLIKCNFL